MTFNNNSNSGNSSARDSSSAGEKLLMVVRQHQTVLEQSELSLADQLFSYGSLVSILVNPKNQGIIASLGLEMANELREKALASLVEYHRQQAGLSLPQLFAQVCDLETDLAGVGVLPAVLSGDNPKPRWTQARVLALVNSPLDIGEISRIRGRTYKEQVYLHNVKKTEQVIQLLGKYGQLTMYQMVALLLNQETNDNQAAPWSLLIRVREAAQVLKLKELITSSPLTGWEGLIGLNLWHLTQPGKIYYAMLNRVDSASLPETQNGLLEHSFGINQVLASLAAACSMASRLGVLDQIVQTIQPSHKLNLLGADTSLAPSKTPATDGAEVIYSAVELAPILRAVRVPQVIAAPIAGRKARKQARQNGSETFVGNSIYSCRLELSHSEPVIELAQDGRKNIRPDAMGLLIYDSEVVLPTVTSAANLKKPASGAGNTKSGQLAQSVQLQRKQSVSGIGQSIPTAPGGANAPNGGGVSLALSEEAEFTGSATTGRQYWPFLLEYDRGTESSKFFAEKVEAYSSLYNTFQLAWPLAWGGKFPLILVVTEGGHSYLSSLMTAVRRALIEIKEHKTAAKRLSGWWFTCTNWFGAAYGHYLAPQELAQWHKRIYPSIAASNARFNSAVSNPGNSSSVGRTQSQSRGGQTKAKVLSPVPSPTNLLMEERELEMEQLSTQLKLGPLPNIWLHLDTQVTQAELANVTKYVHLSAQKRASSQPPQLFSYMRSFPIPHVFNDLI